MLVSCKCDSETCSLALLTVINAFSSMKEICVNITIVIDFHYHSVIDCGVLYERCRKSDVRVL